MGGFLLKKFYLVFLLLLTGCSNNKSISQSSVSSFDEILKDESSQDDFLEDSTFVKREEGYLLKKYRGNLKKVVFPSSYLNSVIIGIEDEAFLNSQVNEIILSDSMYLFSKDSFSGINLNFNYSDDGCFYLPSVSNRFFLLVGTYGKSDKIKVNEECKIIKSEAFYHEKARRIEIPHSVEYINKNSIFSCDNLRELIIETDAIQFQEDFISDCNNLEIMLIDDSFFHEDFYNSFSFCSFLFKRKREDELSFVEDVVFEDGCYYYQKRDGEAYLLKCSIFERRIIIKSKIVFNSEERRIRSINSRAIISCIADEIIIEEGIERIEEDSFIGLDNIIYLSLPRSVSYIANNAFSKCKNLQMLYISSDYDRDMSMFFYPELDIYFKEEYKGDTGLIRNYHEDVKNFVLIDEIVYVIRDDHAYVAQGLKNISKADILNYVYVNDFYYPVTYIDKKAFMNCKFLSEVIIKSNVEMIKERAFYGCDMLKSISVPKNVKRIESSVFSSNDMIIKVDNNKNDVDFNEDFSIDNRIIYEE